MDIFGYSIKRKEPARTEISFVPPSDDGALDTVRAGGYYGTYLDLDNAAKNESDLIQRYRTISLMADVDSAIDDIINESIANVEDEDPIDINLDDVKAPDSIKKAIKEEFVNILQILDFKHRAHDYFRRWYVAQMNPSSTQGLKITKDAICYVSSGLIDVDNNMILSYLHKAIKTANQLRMMENALVIYRLARAPERRIFYIDVGNLPKLKAEQYIKDIMNRYRNKLVYDANTGEIRDDKKTMSLLEDFWLPRREGLQQQSGLNFGRAAEINRDELKFTKFINKLRRQFSRMFDDLLKTQLVLKGVTTETDWEELKEDIKYQFAQDAYYSESKDQELLRSRIELLSQLADFDGKYVSKSYIQKNVLRLTDDEIKQMDSENEKAASAGMDYSEPLEDPNKPGNILPKGSPFPAPPEKKNGAK